MSEFRKVTEDFSVAPQISVGDVARAAHAGFALVINNRPDGEAPDQPSDAEIKAAAHEAGMDYAFIPVRGAPTPEQVAAERAVLEAARGPVLAFCRSGTRSIITWSLGEAGAGARSREELVKLGAAAGYDLKNALASA